VSDAIQPGLFGDDLEADAARAGAVLERAPVAGMRRVLWPNRTQIELRPCDLESLLPAGHRARLVWAWVERADLSAIYAGIRAVEGGSGRSAIAPEILFALWLYAILEGVGSARALARLTQEHDAYRWICGGVSVNHHSLSDFRTAHGEALDGLLTESVALLLAEGVVSLKRVAQDGVRVRASAGAASFRRGATLTQCLEAARTQVETLKRQGEDDPSAESRRRQAARERAARERQERLERALARLPEMAEIKARQGKPREQARVSSSDPEATVMKMADGGFRPAYNGQFTTDTDTQVIVGVEAASVGTDSGQLTPMREQVVERYGQHPEEWLVDGGYATHEQLEQAATQTTVYAPVPKARDPETDPYAPKDGDSVAIAAWRERMGTEEAKAIYTERAATAECVNALARQRGLTHLRVRGRTKVRCVLLLHALAHNLMRTLALAPQLLGYGGGASGQPVMAT
jgi:transposase